MKERVPIGESKGFARLKRNVAELERQGKASPQELQEMQQRLVEWDRRLLTEYRGWYSNFPVKK